MKSTLKKIKRRIIKILHCFILNIFHSNTAKITWSNFSIYTWKRKWYNFFVFMIFVVEIVTFTIINYSVEDLNFVVTFQNLDFKYFHPSNCHIFMCPVFFLFSFSYFFFSILLKWILFPIFIFRCDSISRGVKMTKELRN